MRLFLASTSVAALLTGSGTPSALADGCYAGPFPFTNNGTVHCIVVSNTSFSGNLVNSGTGTISPGEPTGIYVNNSTITGQISNAGTISASGPGILIQSNSVLTNGISNSGTIAAGGTGIFVDNVSTFSGGISNSGTLSAGNVGIAIAEETAFISTFLGGVSNSGTITARTGIFVGPGVTNFFGGIGNSGTIVANSRGIVVNGTSASQIATFSGGISNSGTISAGNTGIFVDNVSTFAGGVSNSGTISAGGFGIAIAEELTFISTFLGGVSNSGIITAGIGILVGEGVASFFGGISNSGTIVDAPGGAGIWVNGPTVFSGGISNSGSIAGFYGIYVDNVSTFSGGISNSGTISAGDVGIAVGPEEKQVSTFLGGISNSGIITAHTGILVGQGVASFFGGISNSGTIVDSDAGAGIRVFGATVFSGGISNGGSITGFNGIVVDNVSSFSGGITNTGTISAATGIRVIGVNGISVFDSGIIASTSGAGGIAVSFAETTSGNNTFTLGPGYSIIGKVMAIAGDTFQLGGTGNGSFDLSTVGSTQQFENFTTFNVVSGTWTVSNTFGLSQAWNVNGGTLAGTGSLNSVNVNNGGTLEPGAIGQPGTFMTINGNLAFQSGAIYLINIDGTTASRANVSGAVTLNGALDVILQSGSYSGKTVYDILDPTSISGRFASFTIVNTPGFSGNLTYTSTGVFLNLTANVGAGGGLNTNQQNVANGINNFFNGGGTLPASFFPLFAAASNSLGNTLTQLSGEVAIGAEVSAFQLTNEFLNLMLDPFVSGRGYAPGATGGGGALGFAPDEQTSLPSDVALAYASILGKAPPQSFDQRWSAWGAAFGGSSTTSGDPTVGSHDVTTGTYGFAAGMDYHVSPSTIVGFALAGAGTNWGLSNGLGSGYSDALQVGTYGITWFGPAYLAGALSFTNHWFTTNRSALGDQLTSNFVGQSYGARFEGGYRFTLSLPSPASGGGLGWGLGVTPYGALQAQDFQTPSYSESDTTGGGFGLSYNAMNATDVRTELGARFDDPTLLYGKPLILFGRVAWAHDFVSNPALSAAFESLPGSTFTVNGAPIPNDSALTTAGAQFFLASNWSLIAKFDGEFANGSQTYGGSGTLRYTW